MGHKRTFLHFTMMIRYAGEIDIAHYQCTVPSGSLLTITMTAFGRTFRTVGPTRTPVSRFTSARIDDRQVPVRHTD